MRNLIRQEQFELEVLDRLNTKKLLSSLVFTEGTMLRLCFGLNRFSADLVFWVVKENFNKDFFNKVQACLSEFYKFEEAIFKSQTFSFQIKSGKFPGNLKVKIQKQKRRIITAKAIAYSKHSNAQVFLKVASLEEVIQAKISSLLEKGQIWECFDIEFLLKKGMPLKISRQRLRKITKIIDAFTKKDFSSKLSSLLEKEEKGYYIKENFKILEFAVNEGLNLT